MQWAGLIAPGAGVLDVAAGGGRHSRFFADRGHRVTALDRDMASFFRNADQGSASSLAEVRQLARQRDVPVYDARSWVGDDGFHDSHHLAIIGANYYTERFGREVLEPELRCLRTRDFVRR